MSEQKLEAYFFTALFIGIFVLVGILFYPFIGALALAMVLAILSMPLYDWLLSKLRRPNLTALIVTFGVTLVVLVPATGLLILLIDEAGNIAQSAANFDFSDFSHMLSDGHSRLLEALPFLAQVDIPNLVQRSMEYIGSHAAAAVTETVSAVFKMFVAIIALFFFIRDGHVFICNLVKLSPLSDDEDLQIVEKLRTVAYSLIRGTMVIAVLQGVLTGIGFVIFGIPNPVLWGSVAAVGALIPTLGTGVVALPAATYLLLTGQYAAAIGFGAWAMLIVGLVDNIIGPKLVGEGARIHPLFILLSVLGGLAVFGLPGFFLGPLIFGILVALSEIYRVKIKEIHRASVEVNC